MRQLMGIYVVVWLLTACAPVAAPAAPRPIGTPQISTDHIGQMTDLTPTEDEVKAARTALGERGFIGLVACTAGSEWHATVVEAAKARASTLGVTLKVFDSKAEAGTQPQAIRDFVKDGARALIVCVLDSDLVKPPLDEATKQGLWVSEYAGSNLNTNGITVGVGDQNAGLGCAAGEIAGELIASDKNGAATVAILDYPALAQIVVRADNIEKCLLQAAPKATIVGRYLGGTTENGLKSMTEALKQHPEIDVVASINDAGAYGALTALQAAGKDSKSTIIVGIDAEAKARELIKAGNFFRGTVDTAPALTGEATINGTVKLLAGGVLPKQVEGQIVKVTTEALK
jgi:ABC-type sugar transport system substrate-binding protein